MTNDEQCPAQYPHEAHVWRQEVEGDDGPKLRCAGTAVSVPQETWVLAGNYRQFVDWYRQEGIRPGDPSVRYILTVQRMLELWVHGCAPRLKVVGTGDDRKDAPEIHQYIDTLRASYGS